MSDARGSAIIVGAGLMGRWHAHAVRQCGGKVLAVVDADAATANALASQLGGAIAYPSLDVALAKHAPTFVHVCTPAATHVESAQTALNVGCHIIVEKPVAPTAALTRGLLQLADAKARLLVPVHQFPFQHGVRTLVGQLPLLGDIAHMDVGLASAGADAQRANADGVAADIVTHCLSLAQTILRCELPLAGWAVACPGAGEWRVSGRANYTSLSFLVSMSVRPTFAELRVLGTRGSAHADLFHGYSVLDSSDVSRTAKATRPFRSAVKSISAASSNLARRSLHSEPAYPGLNELVRQSYLAAQRELPSPITAAQTLNIAEVRDVLMALHAQSRA